MCEPIKGMRSTPGQSEACSWDSMLPILFNSHAANRGKPSRVSASIIVRVNKQIYIYKYIIIL